MPPAPAPTPRPRVVIVGGGFAGLYAARALARAPVTITVIDRRNHHVFQPLLYQVATAALSPAQIAAPIRHVLRRQRHTRVLLANAVSVDTAARVLRLSDGELPYDRLIVAAGFGNWYYGRDDWAAHAPGLKSIEDALEIRRRFLLAFEAAERERDPEARRAELTFVVIGGGPTGVELAGAIAEISRKAIPTDFREVDTATARVILIEGQDRVLPTFPPELSRRAKSDLEQLGVQVWLGTRVSDVGDGVVELGSERLAARNIIWAAGVRASPLVQSLGAPLDRLGRVEVEPDLSVPGRPEVFVVGDLARVVDPRTGREVPGICPAAIQMGRHAARLIAREARSGDRPDSPPDPAGRTSFRYRDKGTLATIGRSKAVAALPQGRFAGLTAWLLWVFVHVAFLIGFRNKVIVLMEWAWAYVTYQRGARLITQPWQPEHDQARSTA